MISKKVNVFLHTAACILLLLYLDAIDAVHQRTTELTNDTGGIFNTSALLETFENNIENNNGRLRKAYREAYREALANIREQERAGSITSEEADALKKVAKKTWDEKKAALIEENKADELYNDNSESFNNTSGFLQDLVDDIDDNDSKNNIENIREGIKKEYRKSLANIREQMKAGTITEEKADALKELAKKTLDEKKAALREENETAMEGIRKKYREAYAYIMEQKRAGNITREEADALRKKVKETRNKKSAP